MANHLAGLRAALAEAEPVDDVIQSTLEQSHERVARVAFAFYSFGEVLAELAFEDAIVVLDLLLFAQVLPIIGEFTAAGLVHAGWVFTSLDGALGRVAARSLKEQLKA